MGTEDITNRPHRIREYIGIFVHGDGETRDGEHIKGVMILEGRLHRAFYRQDLEFDAARKEVKGIKAKVLEVKSGDIIFEREIPEKSIKRRVVGVDYF